MLVTNVAGACSNDIQRENDGVFNIIVAINYQTYEYQTATVTIVLHRLFSATSIIVYQK